MKNIIKLFSVAVMALSLSSCSDFLEEKVTTSFATSHMYATEASLNADILGCYCEFSKGGFLYGPMHEWLQPASGLLHWGGSTSRKNNVRYPSMLNFTRTASLDVGYWSYTQMNKAAYVSNALLGALPSSTAPEDVKKMIEGEGYFVRASAYFFLVRLYGDISYADTPPTSVAEVCTPRANFWEVYNSILQDYTKAFELMPDYNQMIALAGGNASGRVCNYGAKAMRSLVYLTIGSLLSHPDDNFWVNRTPEFKAPDGTPLDAKKAFELALADAEDVINNGPFELAPSYGQLFRWGGRDKTQPGQYPEDFQLKERIFVIPRTAEGLINSNTSLVQWTLPPNFNGTSGSSNAGRTIPTRFVFQRWCESYGGVKGTDSDNSNIYVDCGDARLKVSNAYGTYIGKNNAVQKLYPSKSCIKGTSATSNKNYTTHSMYNIKYYDATFNNNAGKADFYVMRYAEVFLIAAEAAASLSGSPTDAYASKAISYVNKILERARKSGDGAPGSVVVNYEGTGTCAEPADWTPSKFATKDDLLTAIFWERCYELNFECHEYFDTHRYGAQWIVDHISKPKNAYLDQSEQDVNFVTFHYGTGSSELGTKGADGTYRCLTDPTLVRKSLICPYPLNELMANTELDQDVRDPNKGQNPKEVCWE